MSAASSFRRRLLIGLMAISFVTSAVIPALAQSDLLPSWNDGAVKTSITDFVARVTTQDSADFVPPEQRIAVFDNDGTLWCERPVYFQLAFAFDRIKAMAAQHPEWRTTQPRQTAIINDINPF
jgi:hypothetical protein